MRELVADRGGLQIELAAALEAARAAGARAAGAPGASLGRRRKGAHDVVTQLDGAIERDIMEALRAAFPHDARFGEEGGSRVVPRGWSGRTWVVDPIDGTINYASGVPLWCISIGLVDASGPLLGVIRDPLRDETHAAIRGAGAWREEDGRRLVLRRLARAADAVVVADPGEAGDRDASDRIEVLRRGVRAIRVVGSIALSLTWLAAGRLDGVLQVRGLQAVDVAAAGLIAAEAGARVTGSGGGRWLDPHGWAVDLGIAAAGPAVHRTLLGRGRSGGGRS
jgi:fructose-1,6-bisphosphatase/inositol monophosphatase family enzyme